MLKKILIGLVILVAGFVGVISMQPKEYRVERSASMAATPDIVFWLVNDFHRWDAWSPWAKRDPSMSKSFDGAPSGEGAIYSWSGNKEVGEGRMTIVGSKEPESVDIKLEFIKPFASTTQTTFTFRPSPNTTTVTWTMTGQNNFMGKAMSLFMDMDKMVGSDFEKGLANMGRVAEEAARARSDSGRVEAPSAPPAPPAP